MKLMIPILATIAAAPVLGNPLPPADEAAAFKAAGFKQHGKAWKACDDPSAGYEPGRIQEVKDLNGDGQPEAIITEGGTYCFGHSGAGYTLLSKQADGKWKVLSKGTGMLTVLSTKGKNGWPDLEIGGPGFCFPVVRWDGKQYKHHREQYEGKPCK